MRNTVTCPEVDRYSLLLQETEEIMERVCTPVLVMSKKIVREKYMELYESFGAGNVYYALKANPHRDIVGVLKELGSGFEISSQGELELLLDSGISPENIISSNPLKPEAFIKSAYDNGIDLFTFDGHTEVEKLSRFAPRSKVCVRLSVSNEGSEWPLSNKFGVEVDQALELLTKAKGMGLRPTGITFHVGSQCTQPNTWIKAIEKSKALWVLARDRGVDLDTLNIGGGFPVEYTKPVCSISEIVRVVKDTVRAIFPRHMEVIVEPGRVLVGDAGILATKVIAKATRDEQQWLYLDVGVFNGLMESMGGIEYSLLVEKDGAMSKWVLAGPSCDSFDVISREAILPELEIGDKVYIMSAGAYTTAYASHFNGFPAPQTCFV